MLPQAMVDEVSVQSFQKKLQGLLKEQARVNAPGWETLYSPRHALHLHPLAKLMNGVATINLEDMDSTPDPMLECDGQGITMDFATNDKPPAWW